MQKLRFVNGKGNEIDLTDNVNFGVVDWDGFSECGNEIQTQTVPFSDGAVFLDTLLEERELSVTVAVQDGGNLERRYELKRELIKAFNPKLGEGYLYYKNDFLEKRIKVVPSLPIFPTKNADNGGTLKADLSFTACDPYWEDIEETELKSDFNTEIKSISARADGDKYIPFTAVFQNVKMNEENEIVFTEKISGIEITEKTLRYKQNRFCTVISTNTGHKTLYNYDLEMINIGKPSKLGCGCFAWGKTFVFYEDPNDGKIYLEVTGDDFRSSYKIELNTGRVIKAVYSELQDMIYIAAEKKGEEISALFGIDNELKCEIINDSEQQYVSICIVDDTEKGCSYIFLTNDARVLYSTIVKREISQIRFIAWYAGAIGNITACGVMDYYEDDERQRMIIISTPDSDAFLTVDEYELYLLRSIPRSNTTEFFESNGRHYAVTERTTTEVYIEPFTLYHYDLQEIVNGDYVTIITDIDTNTVRTKPFVCNGTLYAARNEYAIEALPTSEMTYIKEIPFESGDVVDAIIETDTGMKAIVVSTDSENTNSVKLITTERKENLIDSAPNLDIVITSFGTTIKSDTGFSISYRNKFIGV